MSRVRRLRTSAVVVIAVVCGSACSVTVGPTKSKPSSQLDESGYRNVWTRDWSSIDQASAPWNSSSNGSPGVCDQGGSKNGCYATDQQVARALTKLETDLRHVDVPTRYVVANRAMLTSLPLEVQGLTDRDIGISQNNTETFTEGITKLRTAGTDLFAAYGDFPADDRPSPALFGPGRHYS